MDTIVKQIPTLKHLLKDAEKDIIRLRKTVGSGPNGEVEMLMMRGTQCVGKKLHGFLLDFSKKDSITTLKKLAHDCNQISHLSHPNVAVFFGLCIFENLQDSSKCLVLIREYAKNDLTHLLEANPNLPLAFKTSILMDVTKALDYLHMCKPAIVHRNLSSSNVLITESLRVKVADMECGCFNKINPLFGKRRLAFVAPEAMKSNPKLVPASDMFSFGQIALHTASHTLPNDLSEGSTEIEKRLKYITLLKQLPAIDKIIVDLIIICLHDSPKNRPTASVAMKELVQLEQKLACKGDKYHSCMKRMTMYEMAEKLVERHEETDTESVTSNLAEERRRSVHLKISQIKDGVPGLLFLKEMVREGFMIRRQQPKWMEYKFEITSDRFLQYSVLNGQVIDRFSLEEVTHITAQSIAGKEVFPFHVYFRGDRFWVLGARSEEERKTWMEAIIPGSTHNQWDDSILHQPLKRSATAPSIHPSHDPAYVKYNEINAPPPKDPPPVPQRPPSTIQETTTDNTYLKLLPSTTGSEMDERTEAVASYTLDQIHLMIEMFEENVQPTSPTSPKCRSNSELTELTIRDTPIYVSEHSSKHPNKGLYMTYSRLSQVMEDQKTNNLCKPENQTREDGICSPEGVKPSSSPRKQGLCRQNAVRCSTTHQQKEAKTAKKSNLPKQESKDKLRKILRQQSSEDMLEDKSYDNPEWSKAGLGEIQGSEKVHDVNAQEKKAEINTLSISTKELHELTNIAIGHYGQVYKAKYTTSNSGQITVTVKAFQEPFGPTECNQFLHDVGVIAVSDNPNVVKLYGYVPENNWLVMEYTSFGDLKKYLRNNQVSCAHLIKYMFDIAMGMHYITAQGLIHRNLALRNILIMENGTCKVADLGMKNRSFSISRYDIGHELSPHTDQRRWMSPENLTRGHFSEASDVWSFGVTQWEMFQPGRVPYSALNSSQFSEKITKGHTLDIPDISPEIVAKIMQACWHWNTTKRPSFMYIASLLIKRTLGEAD